MNLIKKPIVSVIIPTFNRAHYVTKAIESVINQTFEDYEIIVIDDGSTDNTREVLEGYRDKIQYIYQENSGVSAARNVGIKLAKGEWVAFLDSDDEWLPNYLSTQMEQVRKNPQLCAHMTNSITIFGDGTIHNTFQNFKLLPKFKRHSYLILEKPFYHVIKHGPWFVQCAIMKRDILLKTGLFDESLTIGEDLDLIACMSLHGPFGFCNKVMVNIYRREESVENLASQMAKKSIYSYESFAKVYKSLINIEILKFREKKMLARALSSNRRATANLLLRSGKKVEARSYYKEALLVYPSIKSFLKYLIWFLPTKASIWFIRKGKNIKQGKDLYTIDKK